MTGDNAKRSKRWIKLKEDFDEHLKIVGLSDNAFRIHVKAMLYACRNETDGFVPDAYLAQFKASSQNELVINKVWHRVEGGIVIHDYLQHQPSQAQLSTRREHGRRAADRRWSVDPE